MKKLLALLLVTLLGVFLLAGCDKSTTQTAGKNITCLAQFGNVIYAGTADEGLFTSKDEGASWTQATNGLDTLCVSAICSDGMAVYVGTQGGINGVFKTTDNGASWVVANEGIIPYDYDNIYVETLFFHEATLYMGQGSKIFISTDGAETWIVLPQDDKYEAYDFCSDEKYLYMAAYDKGIFRSADGGSSWESISNVKGLGCYNTSGVEWDSKALYTHYSYGIFASTDQGDNWIRAYYGLKAFTFASENGAIYIGGNSKVVRSFDAGLNWEEFFRIEDGKLISGILFYNNAYYISTGTKDPQRPEWGNGIYKSVDNGATWVNI